VFLEELVVALSVTIFLLAVEEVGYRMGRATSGAGDDARRDHIGAVSSIMLGLLSLLLGFSFSMAVERYSVRRDLVVKEANAIATTWLRAGLLPQPRRREAKRLLQRFVDVRLRLYAAAGDSLRVADALRLGAEIELQLWHDAEESANEAPNVVSVAFITALNQLIDTDAERIAAARNQVPGGVWMLLVVVAAIGCWTSAYAAGCSQVRSRLTSVLLPLIVSMVILLIVDLTHESRGSVGISQQPLIDLQRLWASESAEWPIRS
jgi:hypothetical protein